MMERALRILAAAAAIVAAAAIAVVSAAFAIYAGVSAWVGPAWGAAAVTAVMALIAVFGVMAFKPRAPAPREEDPADASLIEKMIDMARDHPLIAVGAAIGAGIYAMRNPKLAVALFAAFMTGRGDDD